MKKNRIIPALLRHSRAFGLGLLVLLQLGIWSFVGWDWWQNYQLTTSLPLVQATTNSSTEFIPTTLEIPAIGLTTPLNQGHITQGRWPIFNNGATFVTLPALTQSDQTSLVIYGHNTPETFGNLHTTQTGQTIILNDNYHQRRYQISGAREVWPTQIEALLPTQPNDILLYTCSGWLDRKRLVVSAFPLD